MPFSITEREFARIGERIETERSLDALGALTQRLADDLRLVRDRLKRTSSNSSMPSGSLAAWAGVTSSDESAAGQDEERARDGAQAPRDPDTSDLADEFGDGTEAAKAACGEGLARPGSSARHQGAWLHAGHYELHHPVQCERYAAAMQPPAVAGGVDVWNVIEWVPLRELPRPAHAAAGARSACSGLRVPRRGADARLARSGRMSMRHPGWRPAG